MTHLDEAQALYLDMLVKNGCKVLFKTHLFGKDYVWLKDKAGTHFLERV